MRPLFGVLLELAALVVALEAVTQFGLSYPFSILSLLIAQGLTTFLIHCPAHYLVGSALGIKFSGMKLGRSTAARAMRPPFKRVGSLLIIFSLSVDSESRRAAPPSRMRAMYTAGVAASVGSAIAFALAVSLTGNYPASLVTWLFALAYLVSDVKLSPKTGDLMRARAVTTPRP